MPLKATPALQFPVYFCKHIRSPNCVCNFVCVEYSPLKFQTRDQFRKTSRHVSGATVMSHFYFSTIGNCNTAEAETRELRKTASLNLVQKYGVWESVLEIYVCMLRT
jgi:hypothetical protein